MEEITKCWEEVPDWRFGQLMLNVFGTSDIDPFFLEEDEMLKCFKKFFKKGENNEKR